MNKALDEYKSGQVFNYQFSQHADILTGQVHFMSTLTLHVMVDVTASFMLP